MLDYRDGTQQTEREKWEVLKRRNDLRAEDELRPIAYPPKVEYLRQWAWELYETVDGPLLWSEMESWMHVNRIRLLPHEVRPLRMMVRAMQARPVATLPAAAADALDFDDDE